MVLGRTEWRAIKWLVAVVMMLALVWIAFGLEAEAEVAAAGEPAQGCPICFVTGRCFDVGGLRLCETMCVMPEG